MADKMVEYLAGRPFAVAATSEWSEYVFDQAAFCKALRDRGVDAQIVFDKPLKCIHSDAKYWKIPSQATAEVAKAWNPDFLGRLEQLGFLDFIFGSDDLDFAVEPNSVVFRFGYYDNFSHQALARMSEWQCQGATVINPLQFYLESKSFMAALALPAVRSAIAAVDESALQVLDQSIAETQLLDMSDLLLDRLLETKDYWLLKFAAWDGNNKSWGSRSLEFGSQHTDAAWWQTIKAYSRYGHPVIAQHVINSLRFDVGYSDEQQKISMLKAARTRLTPFLLRRPDNSAAHAGATITLRKDTFRIHGATDAVEAPVVFSDEEVNQ
jgi:hypothetical protein